MLARSDRRLGPEFKESSAECQAGLTARLDAVRRGAPMPTTPPAAADCGRVQLGLGTVSMKGTQMVPLANFLVQIVGRPVIDRTALSAFYDLTLKWAPDASGNPAPFGLPAGVLPQAPQPPADPDTPDIFTAVQELLGLKLEPGRAPAPVFVVEKLQRPSEN